MAEGVGCKVVGVEYEGDKTKVTLLPNGVVEAIGKPIKYEGRFISNSNYQLTSQPQKGCVDPYITITINTPLGCMLEQYDDLVAYLAKPITILVSEKCTSCSLRQTCPVYKPNGYKSLKTLSIQ